MTRRRSDGPAVVASPGGSASGRAGGGARRRGRPGRRARAARPRSPGRARRSSAGASASASSSASSFDARIGRLELAPAAVSEARGRSRRSGLRIEPGRGSTIGPPEPTPGPASATASASTVGVGGGGNGIGARYGRSASGWRSRHRLGSTGSAGRAARDGIVIDVSRRSRSALGRSIFALITTAIAATWALAMNSIELGLDAALGDRGPVGGISKHLQSPLQRRDDMQCYIITSTRVKANCCGGFAQS